MSEALLDVNLLIASVVENHVDHARALRFLASLDRFHTTPTTQGGFLRFLTRPWKNEQKQEQPPRMTVANAFATLRDLTQSAQHTFLPDDEPFTSVSLRSQRPSSMDRRLPAATGSQARPETGDAGAEDGQYGRSRVALAARRALAASAGLTVEG